MSSARSLLFPVLAVATMAVTLPVASGQGLLGIGKEGSRVKESIPVKVGLGAWAGYDSNATTSVGGTKEETAYYGGSASLRYAYVTSQTRFDLRFNFTGLYQDAGGGSLDDMVYNTRLLADFSHRFNRRTSIVNNAMVSWEVEPDFMVGASAAQRDGQYFYFWDRIALWLSLTNRLTSVTSYAIEGVRYQDDPLKSTEDRLTHTFGQQLRFAWSERTTTKAEYRYGINDYDSLPQDSHSHYLLAGIDQQFGDDTLLTLMAGAENRTFDTGGDKWKPYAEASVLYQMTDATVFRWLLRSGFENNEISGYEDRYSIRTGVVASHAVTDRLGVSAGVAYVYSELDGASGGPSGIDERGIQANADVTYALLPHLDVSAGYQYSDYDSGDNARDYDRHRVSVAATTTF